MDNFGNKRQGFSIVELIVVILVIAILAGLLNFKWFSDALNLNAQVSLLAADLRTTQMLAMSNGERYKLAKTSDTSYQVTNSTGTVINGVTLSSGISFGGVAWSNLGNNYVVFDGKGVPYTDDVSPGTPLSATAVITLYTGSSNAAVTIDPTTGRITP